MGAHMPGSVIFQLFVSFCLGKISFQQHKGKEGWVTHFIHVNSNFTEIMAFSFTLKIKHQIFIRFILVPLKMKGE